MKYFIAFVWLCASFTQSYAATTYTIREFGIEKSAHVTFDSLNQSGTVAGQYSQADEVTDFFWNAKNGLHVITSNGQKGCTPYINNRDQIAGITSNQLYLYEPDKGMVLLGRPKGWNRIVVIGINDLGQILVGHGRTGGYLHQYAMWHQGRFVNLDLPGYPVTLNSSGDVLLWNLEAETGIIYNLTSGEKTVLAKGVYVGDINDKRHVLGYLNKEKQRFLWTPEKGLVVLPFVPYVMNNLDHMISTDESTPTLWIEGEKIDLNQSVDLIKNNPESNWIDHAIKMNDKGQILAMVVIDKSIQVVLLDPQTSAEKDDIQQTKEE